MALPDVDPEESRQSEELARLLARENTLDAERAKLTSDLRDLEGQRRDHTARLQELRSFSEVERARLAEAADEAEREASARPGMRSVSLRAESARAALTNHDISLTEDVEAQESSIAELDARLAVVSDRIPEIDRELAVVRDAIRRLTDHRHATRQRRLETELERLAPLVEAQREAVGASGITDLSEDYDAQADDHAKAWKLWGSILIVVLAAAVAGSLVVFHSSSVPEGEVTAQTVVTIARNLFIVGLLLYAVRLASLQFRVHRHLEVVARNKAAALSTFNRIVAVASETEIRNSIAVVLAQSVFNSDETGFVDAGQDHITLVERLASSVSRPAA